MVSASSHGQAAAFHSASLGSYAGGAVCYGPRICVVNFVATRAQDFGRGGREGHTNLFTKSPRAWRNNNLMVAAQRVGLV